MRLPLMLATLGLALTIANPARADEALANEHLTELAQMAQLIEGFSLRPDVWNGTLHLEEDAWVETQLAAGNEYVILLGVDVDDHGILVEIVDANHQVVARSTPSDMEVLCRFRPEVTATYGIRFVRLAPEHLQALIDAHSDDIDDEAAANDPDETPDPSSVENTPTTDEAALAYFAAQVAYR